MSESSSSSAALTRLITLRRREIAEYVEGRTQGYRVHFDVIGAVDIPSEIFVYQRKLGTVPGVMIDEFSNIASPADIEEYPTTKPELTVGFYRLAYVDLIFRNIKLLTQTSEDLVRDVSALVEALNQLDLLIEHDVTFTGVDDDIDF